VAAERAGISRQIFTSSVAVYGDSPTALREDDPHNWINEYGRTKSLAEIEYRNWKGRSEKNRLVIVRPTVIFGPGNRGNVYNLLKQIGSGRFLMVGDGTNRKSMAYVGNIADFLVYVANLSGDMHIYNYADEPDFDMNSLVSLVRSDLGRGHGVGARLPGSLALAAGYLADGFAWVTGRNLPVSAVRVRKFQANTAIDASKAFGTGFRPRTTLSEGLKQTLRADFGR
jgi:nucleoside-diphosphate-sugar epimerase